MGFIVFCSDIFVPDVASTFAIVTAEPEYFIPYVGIVVFACTPLPLFVITSCMCSLSFGSHIATFAFVPVDVKPLIVSPLDVKSATFSYTTNPNLTQFSSPVPSFPLP